MQDVSNAEVRGQGTEAKDGSDKTNTKAYLEWGKKTQGKSIGRKEDIVGLKGQNRACSLKFPASNHLQMFLCSPFSPTQSLTPADMLRDGKNQSFIVARVF